MKKFTKQDKKIKGWGYWGEVGEIEVGISSGEMTHDSLDTPDALHVHLNGDVYIVVTHGSGIIEVDGNMIELHTDEVCEIKAREKYKMVKATSWQWKWITFCTVKDSNDKVTVT